MFNHSRNYFVFYTISSVSVYQTIFFQSQISYFDCIIFCSYIHLFSFKKNASEFTPSLFIGLLLIENVTNKANVLAIVFHCI